ncbi:MAG: hypothetical protein WC551_08795 [Patescibacteria group bacterium]
MTRREALALNQASRMLTPEEQREGLRALTAPLTLQDCFAEVPELRDLVELAHHYAEYRDGSDDDLFDILALCHAAMGLESSKPWSPLKDTPSTISS